LLTLFFLINKKYAFDMSNDSARDFFEIVTELQDEIALLLIENGFYFSDEAGGFLEVKMCNYYIGYL